jgi:hypothetical protein
MEEDAPVTPLAAPSLDAQGVLSYVGADGRRYVVGLPPEIDEARMEQVMTTLRGGGDLFIQIESLCHRWIQQVSGPDLSPHDAMVLLLTTLETALEDRYPEAP